MRRGRDVSVRTGTTSGLDRARARVRNLDEQDIAWQVEVIRQNTSAVSRRRPTVDWRRAEPDCWLGRADRADRGDLPRGGRHGRRRDVASRHSPGSGAAWIGLGWLGDSEVSQLAVLGPDLYNGACGIALFLAAHAAVKGGRHRRELALAAVSQLRKNSEEPQCGAHGAVAGHWRRHRLGLDRLCVGRDVEAARDDDLLDDAHRAAELFSDDLIAADKQLDVIGGSAGAILGLLRLHRDTQCG